MCFWAAIPGEKKKKKKKTAIPLSFAQVIWLEDP